MSQEFLDPELVADFIIESREHLETIEPNLLELEKTPENLVLLNDIFRPMHSLKGASGFLGLNRINKLAHRAENVLDELRKGTMTVDSVIMDIILATTDAFNNMLNSLEETNSEGDTPIDHLVDLLDRILAGERFTSMEEALNGGGAVPVEQTQAAEPVTSLKTINNKKKNNTKKTKYKYGKKPQSFAFCRVDFDFREKRSINAFRIWRRPFEGFH